MTAEVLLLINHWVNRLNENRIIINIILVSASHPCFMRQVSCQVSIVNAIDGPLFFEVNGNVATDRSIVLITKLIIKVAN